MKLLLRLPVQPACKVYEWKVILDARLIFGEPLKDSPIFGWSRPILLYILETQMQGQSTWKVNVFFETKPQTL